MMMKMLQITKTQLATFIGAVIVLVATFFSSGYCTSEPDSRSVPATELVVESSLQSRNTFTIRRIARSSRLVVRKVQNFVFKLLYFAARIHLKEDLTADRKYSSEYSLLTNHQFLPVSEDSILCPCRS